MLYSLLVKSSPPHPRSPDRPIARSGSNIIDNLDAVKLICPIASTKLKIL
ncbi:MULTISPECIES: hypothetical protein [unclassified Microcoleus]